MSKLKKFLFNIKYGKPGPQGPPGPMGMTGEPGVGVPPRGKKGQVLIKKSDADYDTEWVDIERDIK